MARPLKTAHPPRDMVLAALRKANKPLSAYDILEKLKKHGVKSPPIVYRALDTLKKHGAIHRIEQLNAYVACNCEASHTHALSLLTVCDRCRTVAELHDHAVIHHIEGLERLGVRLPDNAVIELPVICEKCQN